MSNVQGGGNTIASPSVLNTATGGGASTPSNAYVAEDGTTFYVAEDGTTFYVQEA